MSNDSTIATTGIEDFIAQACTRHDEHQRKLDAEFEEARQLAQEEAKAQLAHELSFFPEPMRPFGQHEEVRTEYGTTVPRLVFRLPGCAPFAAWKTMDGGFGFNLPSILPGGEVVLDTVNGPYFAPLDEAIASAKTVHEDAEAWRKVDADVAALELPEVVPALDDDEVAVAPPADDREVLVPDGWGDLINDAFYDLGVARKDHNDAVGQLEDARARLDDVRVDLIVNGLVEGKNAEAREADLADKCQSEIKRVRSAERGERDERLKLDLAKDAVRRLEMLIALRGK